MNTLFFGHAVKRFRTLDSTNKTLKSYAQSEQLPEGFIVTAGHQISGRGQFGNQWVDEAGENLLISLYLRPKFLKASQNFRLSMSVCLGLQAFARRFAEQVQIKWPNDLLIARRKAAGILIENQIGGGRLESSIVGIGLNVNQRHFATENSTSLAREAEQRFDLRQVEAWLLEDLEQSYFQLQRHPQELMDRYLSMLYGFDSPVAIALANGRQDLLQITSVADNGALQGLLGSSGQKVQFYFKELRFIY